MQLFTRNMALPVTAVFLAVLSFFASCGAQKNCSEVQCELLPVGEHFASEFQFKAFEIGVRMVYLNLWIKGNESYEPLELGNEFLPERWVWAASIGELMLSLSYDYDILSLGLLKRQVRKMSVQLNDRPSGCLANLNSSCKNKVVGRVLLGNVTTSSAKKYRQDVVCVAVINDHLNLLENFFEGDVEYRCCKMVKLGVTDSIQCEESVERSNWFKAFYIVLNILTVFVAIYLPALFLFALPDFIFNLRKEYEKEKEDKKKRRREGREKEKKRRRGMEDPWKKFAPVLMGEWRKFLAMMRSNWLPTRNKKDYLPIPGSTIETVPLVEFTSARHKASKFTYFRREDRIPVDDGSPFTISRLLHMCNSGAEAFQGLVKLSFNIKLLILWYYIMPIFVIVEFVLYQTVKNEFFEELATKRKAFLVGNLFFLVDMSKHSNQITLIVSYVIFPSFVIMILKKGDFIEKEKPCPFPFCTKKLPRYIDKEVWNHLEIIPKKVSLVFPYIAKFPIMFWLGFQIFCSRWISDSSDDYWIMKRIKRYLCSWFVLILIPVTLVVTVALTAIVWFVFLIFIIILLIICTPQATLSIFFVQKWLKKPKYLLTFLVIVGGWVLITLILKIPLKYSLLFHVCFSVIYPTFLGLHFCRFIVRMFGFTIIGLTFNAEIAAPLVTFAWLITSNMHECLCNFQGLYRDVKQMIYQEWQKGIEKLDQEVPKSTIDTIPADLFWYVCNESKVLPVWREVFRMLCNTIVIFLSAFFALTAIFFGTTKYQIPTVASTIAVYVSGEFPMLFLREMHKLNFSGWKKIERNEKVKISVNEFITKNYDSRRKRCATI